MHRESDRRAVRGRHESPWRRAHRLRERWPCRLQRRPLRDRRWSSARSAISSCASADFGSSAMAFGSILGSLAVEAVCRDEGETDIGLGIRRISGQRFAEEIGCVGVVEALVKQHAPAHFVESACCLRAAWRGGTARWPAPILRDPRSLRRGRRRSLLRVSASKQACASGGCPCLRRTSSLRRAACAERGPQPSSKREDGSEALHFVPSSSCTFASSTSASVSCFL